MIVGPSCDSIAFQLLKFYEEAVIITDSYDSLMQIKLQHKNEDKIKCKMMDYAHTDFEPKYFDLIYAQASLNIPNRKEIIKEIKRILSPDGLICNGEIVSIKEPVAAFVKDIWARSGLEPLSSSKIKHYFEEKGFTIIAQRDLSITLEDFYQKIRYKITKANKEEKKTYKKIYSAVKHEADAYLKLGGDKFIGFTTFIMRTAN